MGHNEDNADGDQIDGGKGRTVVVDCQHAANMERIVKLKVT